MEEMEPRNFREFWPFYVGEHLDARNRRLHVLGTGAALAFILAAVVAGQPWWLVGAPLAGYGLAWIGHATLERNRPTTFRHPVYSLIGDFRMFGLTLMGRMQAEVARVRDERARGP